MKKNVMKGIIIDYKTEKGFGFIKDENEDKRFFHINNIKERKKFLKNIDDFFYTTYYERICYVVTFIPGENEKGLNATNINLTKQIFNDKTQTTPFKVEITNVHYLYETITWVATGIKNGRIPLGATSGGYGTYRVGYPEVIRELNIHFRRVDDIGWGTIDVRDLALEINKRSKITKRFIENLKNKLVGQIVTIKPYNKTWNTWVLIDPSILKI